MKLFDELNWQPCEPRPHRIETPLGAIASRALVDGSELNWARASFFAVRGSDAWGARWEAVAGQAEVLVARPRLVADYHVKAVDCWAFLWRFVAASQAALAFEACWDGAAMRGGDIASGQYLMALEWDDGRAQVSLGAEDDEALIWRARRGDWLPSRFAERMP